MAAALVELASLLECGAEEPLLMSSPIPTELLGHLVPDTYLEMRRDPAALPQVLATISMMNYTSPFRFESCIELL